LPVIQCLKVIGGNFGIFYFTIGICYNSNYYRNCVLLWDKRKHSCRDGCSYSKQK